MSGSLAAGVVDSPSGFSRFWTIDTGSLLRIVSTAWFGTLMPIGDGPNSPMLTVFGKPRDAVVDDRD